MISVATQGHRLSNKHFVSDTLWGALTSQIVKDNDDINFILAERIMDQTIGYLRLCAANLETRFCPSPMVDIGWHTFIFFDTRAYMSFCDEIAGRYLHHKSNDESGEAILGLESSANENIARTVVAMRDMGLDVDELLWASPAAGRCVCG